MANIIMATIKITEIPQLKVDVGCKLDATPIKSRSITMSCKTSEMIEGKLHYHVVCVECHCVFTVRSIHYIGIYKDWCGECSPE